MRLSVDHYCDTLLCPYCGVSIDIEPTYEETLSSCSGIADCPQCEKPLRIEASVKFTLKETNEPRGCNENN